MKSYPPPLPLRFSDDDESVLSRSDRSTLAWRDPQKLLNARRFDIVAKYLYAAQRKRGERDGEATAIYRTHLEIWNDFFEESPPKKSFEDFCVAFDALLDASETCDAPGLPSVVPLSPDENPLNGSHRIAAALLHGHKVLSVRAADDIHPVRYDIQHFRKLAAARGLNLDPVFDRMAIGYAQIKRNSRAIVILDPPRDAATTDAVISRFSAIVYDRVREFSVEEKRNLLMALRCLDSEIPFVRQALLASEQVRFVLIDPLDTAAVLLLRDLRASLGSSPAHVHVCDPDEQTHIIAGLAFGTRQAGNGS